MAKWTAMGEDSRSILAKSSAWTRWGKENGEPSPGIQLFGATTFYHLWVSKEVVEAFAIRLGECQRLLGSSLEGITESETNPMMLKAPAGAAAIVAAEEWHSNGAWMTATSSLTHEGRNWTTGVVYCNELFDPANPGPLPISTLSKHNTMQTRLMRIGTDIVNVEMGTDDGGRIPAQYQDFRISRLDKIKICHILVRYKDHVDVNSKILQLSHRTFQGIEMLFMRKSDSDSRIIVIALEEMTEYPVVRNHTNCMDLRHLENSEPTVKQM
jgi:hypothetical protein